MVNKTDAYLVNRSGMQIGPFSLKQCAEMLRNGQFLPSDLVWQPGMAEWRPLGEILSIGALAIPASAQPANLMVNRPSIIEEPEESIGALLGKMGCGCLLWIGLLILAVGGGVIFPFLLLLLPVAFIGGIFDLVKKISRLSKRNKNSANSLRQ